MKNEITKEALCPSHNSGYMVPLRFTQIFAPLRSAKTSYSRGTLDAMPEFMLRYFMFINIFHFTDLYNKIDYQYSLFSKEKDDRIKVYILFDIILSLNHLPEWIINNLQISTEVKKSCLSIFNPYKTTPTDNKLKEFTALLRVMDPYPFSKDQYIIRSISNGLKHFKIQSPKAFLYKYQQGFGGYPSLDNFGDNSVLNSSFVIDKTDYLVETDDGDRNLIDIIDKLINQWKLFCNKYKVN